ncbi:cysteine-rich CWC family protein [Bradyrhizobium sp. Tv2a-2]|uniref:cysteine-rich CWC family protein n=1 Tax=Bradyrhizobium sp. Tv2a-2 TaxID=113395 RepID=UPI0009FDCD2F|nr:cysteine-rich CWC family protein [Bradyrhizobium sp. Tv2a-2]
MTNRKESLTSRRVNCSSCGTAFGCDPDGACWCMDETARLPMPEEGAAGCLCPSCLRKRAREQQQTSS